MKSLLRSVTLTLVISTLMAEEMSELALTQHPFRVYSAFWPNLHHVLLSESMARRAASAEKLPGTESEANLTADEQRTWEAAVTYYSRELADLHPLFEMGPIRRALLAAKVEPPMAGLESAHRQVLAAAASVYRKHRWSSDDRGNRDWISESMSKVASLSPAVSDRLSRVYGVAWFTSPVRVDVVPIASREGAFTSINPAPAHITISSRNPVITDWTAAEVLFHESSHALAQPMIETFAAELKAQGKNARDLWHVALFFLTGEVVRQALSERGIAYEPYLYSTGLFDHAWPQYKSVIESIGEHSFSVRRRKRRPYSGLRLPRRPNYGKIFEEQPALKRTVERGGGMTSDSTIIARARMMKAVDESLGRILTSLEKSRQLADTVVIFTFDHGYFYGEHGLGP